MTADPGRRGRVTGLTDRRSERAALGRLVEAVRAGQSRVLVVRGDPGVGKTALLEYLAGRASGSGCRVERAVGVQSEMELAFAGLHLLCAPMLDYLDRLPVPQRDALRTVFGLAAGPPPDRLLVGLAVLGLLSEVAGERPLVCLVDDEQWLDRASAQALGFAARRLAADPVGLVFAARQPGDDLGGLPELVIEGLREDDARALLEAALAGPLDARVRDLIVAETRGNPLALLELPRGLSPAELAGGFGLPGAGPLAGRIEDSFARQLDALPAETRRLLQLAAADPSGDRSLVGRAAGRLGIGVQAAAPAVEAGLAEFGARVRFRHPLARSAAYRSAPFPDRQRMHAALADVTDPATDPDRRAWHRAQAAPGPDEEVAVELERSAGRAQARGGLAAAAAFLERAVLLTADPARHAGRALAAAWAHWAAAVLYNGLARYQEAATAARQATSDTLNPWMSMWALPELVEAATRIGDTGLARDALARLAETTQPCGTDPALGIEARCRALLSDGAAADGLYREAIGRLSRTRLRPELARAHLLYGEWLRRGGRRVAAREQLRAAHDMLAAIGMAAFAGRARRELVATGGTVTRRTFETRDDLTPQEEQIARLARDGLSNPEIGARLFLSPRTVEWHLRKVFTKLGIGSRHELKATLAQFGQDGRSA